MALVTVADVLHSVLAPLPGGGELLGGASGLDHEVTWTMSARPSSPIFPTLKPGELALAAAPHLYELDPPATLAPLVEWLAERGAAGLVLRGPLEAGERDAGARVADAQRLPLLQIGDAVSLLDLERAITTLVRERRDEFYGRVAHLQEVEFQITEGAAGGRPGSLEAVVQTLATLVGAPTGLTGPPPTLDLRYLAPGAPAGGTGSPLAAAWPLLAARALAGWQAPGGLRGARPAEPPVRALDAGPGTVLLVAPVLVRDRLAAALLLAVPAPPAEIDKLTLARAAGICALEMTRRQAVVVAESRTEQRLRGEFVADLLYQAAGGNAEVLLARARALGLEIAPAYAVALLAPAPGLSPPAGEPVEALFDAATAALRPALRESGALTQALGGRLAVLWPLPARTPAPGVPRKTHEPLVRLTEELRRQVESRGSGPLAGGVGRIYPGVDGAARSRQEAEQALWSAWHLFHDGQVYCYRDLGIYRLLLPLREQHRDELRTFYEETLGVLGGPTGGEASSRAAAGAHAKLLDTLEAFLAHGSNISETAAALFLHRNTLSYRLQRISEIAGLDLTDPGIRFQAQVALYVRRLLQS